MMFFIEDTHAGNTLAQKISEEGKSGAIIRCNKDELEASKNMVAIGLGGESNKPLTAIEVDTEKTYIFVANESVNIDDIKRIIHKGFKARIIRTLGSR